MIWVGPGLFDQGATRSLSIQNKTVGLLYPGRGNAD